MAISPQFLFSLESNMRVLYTRDYKRMLSKSWWNRVAKTMASGSKKERVLWLLETAKIARPQASRGGGQARFEDLAMQTTEYENQNANTGLQLKMEQLEDLDGNGVQLASAWSGQTGAYAAYWPQKEVARAIKANGTAYDGQAFFSTAHQVNPFLDTSPTFANVFTGAANGAYPGALPIDTSVSVDVALANLAKAIAYIAVIPTASGEDPRNLRVDGILVPPALAARAQQLTNAKFLAQSAAGGAGSADVQAVISNMGLGTPVEAPELAAAFGGSDTDYYLIASEVTSDDLGALVYVDREPFSVLYHGPMTSSELARKREFQWTCEGRNTVGYGHPYLLFKCRAT